MQAFTVTLASPDVSGTGSVLVRPARSEDAAGMHGLAQVAYGRYLSRMRQRPGPMDADYAAVVGSDEAWVASSGSLLAGILVLQPAEDHLVLANLAVHPDLQGQGLGGRLLGLAEERARALGLTEVRLYTHELMTENIEYYTRHGYRETHRSVEHGFRRVFMTKSLVDLEPAG